MPRSKLPSLNSIKDGSFEPNRKNAISLGDDSVLSTDSKPIKIGDKSSILELSEDSLIIRGAIEFDTLLRGILNSPNERMAFTAKTGEYRWYSTSNDEDYVRMFVLGGNCLLQAVDASGGTEADISLDAGNDIILDAETGVFSFQKAGDLDDLCTLTVAADGATTIATADSDGAAGHLTLDPDGDLIVSGADVKIDATQKLYLDGGSNSYIYEEAADTITLVAGGTSMIQITETPIGNYVRFESCGVGFDQIEPTYDSSNTVVSFDAGNKQFLTFGSGNITTIKLGFPLASGNFTLILKQDGTGSRTITNWNVYDISGSAASGSSTVKWAGGSAPTLTTDANHVDILSFYWDADNEIAYGVATLDFQF